jgi:hypothetical protein
MLCSNKFRQVMAALPLTLLLLFFFTARRVQADNPTVTVVAPSHEIGDLGAALGNTWTMDSEADVVWRQPDSSGDTVDYTLRSGIGGAYGQVLEGRTPKGSDLASSFYTHAGVALPDQTYRYLIYRSYIAPQKAGEAGDQRTNGRILYSSSWGPNWLLQAFPQRRYSKPHSICGYGRWCVYFFDLHQNINGAGSPNPWDWGEPNAVVKAFGLWPHENWATPSNAPSGDSPDYFYLDFLYLTGPIVTSPPPNSRYTVRWNVGDADGGRVTSKLYYQEKNELLLPSQRPACNASLNGWRAIPGATTSITLPSLSRQLFLPLILKGAAGGFGSGVIGPHNQSFQWSLSSAAYQMGKVYYVCVEVTDQQGYKSYGVSSAPVIKVPAPTRLTQG